MLVSVLVNESGAATEPSQWNARFAYLTACVDDPEAASQFLRTTLGWHVIEPTPEPGGNPESTDPIRVEDGRGFQLHLRRAMRGGSGCTGSPYLSLAFSGELAAPGHRVEFPVSVSGGTQVLLESNAGSVRVASEGPAPRSARVDRIAIFVADLELASTFYTNVLGLTRSTAEVQLDGAANARSGGLRVAFIDAGAVWLALVQPVGSGPLMDLLRRHGDGYIAELIVEVDDLASVYDSMQAHGIGLVDTAGTPVDPTEKAHVLVPYGDRIAYFPTDVAQGLVIELAQRGPAETSLLERRDRAPRSARGPRKGARGH